MVIDLNSDLGEGGPDAELLPLLTSANVCCGAHAGSPELILRTLQLAVDAGVAVGAHPGHPDRAHFGRRELATPLPMLREQLEQQIDQLTVLAHKAHATIRYLKAHGGLYHQACRDEAYAELLVSLVEERGLAVIGLPGSTLARVASGRARFFAEGFADRGYRADGTLIPRDQPHAFIESPTAAVEQVRRLVHEQSVRTVCVHGDNPSAIAFVRSVRDELLSNQIELRAFA